ncbi:excinuclease ABC subunit UvrC [Jeotgalibaca arthritidis]|uniref:UvrABC system protein C n=1 Tax=Jeotgalibaca arthritidis TaxID=1868794 RepID=A0A6G7KAM7_9LACT|nr:excinuclease ABC subunit UvrC [Jeotgalibaca arthritidis]QII82282.1 excinuclease ABC subunit UvrC [Jeotgalibaca arthritidis]
MSREEINQKLAILPELPGCYIMRNKDNDIIYIGKAKNLRSRVKSYFHSKHEGKTALLVADIDHFEIIVTKTDKESLLLEINLIKQYQPKYNIKLKQGTMYPYLKITNEKDPQLIITSIVEDDGGVYFGPYPNVYAASETQQFIQKVYPLRKCNKGQKRACLYYHMGQCIGCCDHEVPREAYDEQIKRISHFLNGDVKEIKQNLVTKMQVAANDMNFEQAAEYRDQIRYIEATVEKQTIMSRDYTNRDVFAFHMDKGWISIQVFLLRQSTVIKREAALFPSYGNPEEELLSFIMQFYQEQNHILPKEILVPEGVDVDLLAEALDIKVHVPKRGSKKSILDLAITNSELALTEKFMLIERSKNKTVGAIQELSEALGLNYLETIESFDHSNIQGTNPVSAMVVYKDGQPDRKSYRKYKVKTVEGANEFATTQEVIRRRYSRLLRERKPLPDLILMDGGKVQIRAAKEVLEDELGIHIPIAGMVKNKKHKTASLMYGDDNDVIDLDPRSQAFHLVQRIQDEVHRFAITFHRQIRGKNSFSSLLDDIDGVGPKTRTKVLRHFKTMTNIRQASLDDIKKLGISEKVATSIKEVFQNEENTPSSEA